ncbi:MAG: type II toxin-antitoxin system RelE/ParE family toxin [Candidatus Accumulibacter sp.]|jgi:plasmid stabilization system protein ParE|nr:type II toxin-antitoxin system RelE/ParE family toxin [Accumulibacter sp.]
MPEVTLSPAALRKLDEAFDYIGTTPASPLAAQKTVDAVLDGLKVLERFPEIGPLVSSRLGNVPERFAKTRFIVCGSYNAPSMTTTAMRSRCSRCITGWKMFLEGC